MMANAGRTPSRTPPFVLVGLLVLVCILAYNYWSLSSENKSLLSKNDKLSIESRDISLKREGLEKSLETLRAGARETENSLAKVKKSLEDKETELNNFRGEFAKVQEEDKKIKDSLSKCDANSETQKKDIEALKVAKDQLEQSMKDTQGKPKTCDNEACFSAVQEIIKITTNIVGTDKMKQTLIDAKLDANKLMNGLPLVAAPSAKAVAEQPQVSTTTTTNTTTSASTSEAQKNVGVNNSGNALVLAANTSRDALNRKGLAFKQTNESEVISTKSNSNDRPNTSNVLVMNQLKPAKINVAAGLEQVNNSKLVRNVTQGSAKSDASIIETGLFDAVKNTETIIPNGRNVEGTYVAVKSNVGDRPKAEDPFFDIVEPVAKDMIKPEETNANKPFGDKEETDNTDYDADE